VSGRGGDVGRSIDYDNDIYMNSDPIRYKVHHASTGLGGQ